MTDMSDLERDIAETRSRLHGTLDEIQSRLTVSGIVDEVLGQAGVPRVEGRANFMLGLLQKHPVPVMVTAAVVGFLIQRAKTRKAAEAATALHRGRADDLVRGDSFGAPDPIASDPGIASARDLARAVDPLARAEIRPVPSRPAAPRAAPSLAEPRAKF